MRRAAAALALLMLAAPAAAETRWLACQYVDVAGKQQPLAVMFDEDRNITGIFQDGAIVEGTNTSINFQSIRTRFPSYFLTYNRNDGTLSLVMIGGGFTSGMLHGQCHRSQAPPGAPRI